MMKIFLFLMVVWCAIACTRNVGSDVPNSNANTPPAVGIGRDPDTISNNADAPRAVPAQNAPRTVRDFFMLLPEKYFVLEGCEKEKDKECTKARTEYLQTFAEIEDTKNGYLKGGCDGAQACMEMALFKRPDGTYLVGLATFAEMMNDFYFLEFREGVWSDVSAAAIPEFSKSNYYQLPRFGTTMSVFAKKIIEKGPDFEASEKGAKLYDLEWKDGKFSVKK